MTPGCYVCLSCGNDRPADSPGPFCTGRCARLWWGTRTGTPPATLPRQRRRPEGVDAPAPDDPDRRPLHPRADPRPRPLCRKYPDGWTAEGAVRARYDAAHAALALTMLRRHHDLEAEVGRLQQRAHAADALAQAIGRLFDPDMAQADTEQFVIVREVS